MACVLLVCRVMPPDVARPHRKLIPKPAATGESPDLGPGLATRNTLEMEP